MIGVIEITTLFRSGISTLWFELNNNLVLHPRSEELGSPTPLPIWHRSTCPGLPH
jgi:hypothetical protein